VRALGGWVAGSSLVVADCAVPRCAHWEAGSSLVVADCAVPQCAHWERRAGIEPGGGRLSAGRSRNGAWRRMPDCWERSRNGAWRRTPSAVGPSVAWELLS
jgi:hypothetical protein